MTGHVCMGEGGILGSLKLGWGWREPSQGPEVVELISLPLLLICYLGDFLEE